MAKSFGDMATEAFGGAEQMAAGAAAEVSAAPGGEAPVIQNNEAAASPPPAVSPETAAAVEAAISQPVAPAAPAAPTDVFMQMAQEFGFQGIEDPEAARQAILADYRERRGLQSQYDQALAQSRDRMQFASEAEQWWSDPEVRQVIQGKFYQQPARPQAAAPAQPAPQAPSLDIRLDDLFQTPAIDMALVSRYRVQAVDPTTGQVAEKWREDTPIVIRQQYDDVESKRQAWAQQLVNNPAAALQPVITRAVEIAEQRAMQKFEQQQVQRQVQEKRQRVQERIRTEDNWVYETDPVTGQARVNPFTGEAVFSEAGIQASKIVTELEQRGITDPEQLWTYARAQTLVSRPDLAARILNFGGVAATAAGRAPTAGESLLGGTPVIGVPQAAARPNPQATVSQRQNGYLRQRSAATPPSRDGIEQPTGRAASRGSFGDAFIANMQGQPAN